MTISFQRDGTTFTVARIHELRNAPGQLHAENADEFDMALAGYHHLTACDEVGRQAIEQDALLRAHLAVARELLTPAWLWASRTEPDAPRTRELAKVFDREGGQAFLAEMRGYQAVLTEVAETLREWLTRESNKQEAWELIALVERALGKAVKL